MISINQLSKNFVRSEFECKCGCGFNVVDVKLIEVLQIIRDQFGLPLNINSACRCRSHNKAVGGSATSQHLLGKAADIRFVDRKLSLVPVYDFLVNNFDADHYGFGLYNTFIHVDVRENGSRWNYTK